MGFWQGCFTRFSFRRFGVAPADLSRVGIVCGDPSAAPNDVVGYGVVDAYAAVKRAVAEE